MDNELIVVLEARPGKNPGEVIGSYQPVGQNKQSPVALPTECEAGKKYRVVLHELPEKDARGRAMFTATPAGHEGSGKTRWQDNRDGTASCFNILTNWKLEELNSEVIETTRMTRLLPAEVVSRSGRLVLGHDAASSYYELEAVEMIPVEKAIVNPKGELLWRREDSSTFDTCSLGLRRLAVVSPDISIMQMSPKDRVSAFVSEGVRRELDRDILNLGVDPSRKLSLDLTLEANPLHPEDIGEWRPTNYRGVSGLIQMKYSELPDWIRIPHEHRFPICECARCRVDAFEQNADGYTRCQICRKEEDCDRCGRKNTPIVMILGRRICQPCEPLAQQEEVIKNYLSPDLRKQLVEQAQSLLSLKACQEPEGKLFVEALLGKWMPKEFRSYPWYYIGKDGIWGSKFSPEALQILSFLDQATGNGLVRLVAWIAGGEHRGAGLEKDFFTKTQVKGEKILPPKFTPETLTKSSIAIQLVDFTAIHK